MHPIAALGLLATTLTTASAFTFSLTSTPQQCGTLSLAWSGGTAPYEITLLPLGHVNPEIRTIVDTNTTNLYWSETLLFPTDSTFVIVLSDATGYGSGGTSVVYTVGSGPSSCLPTSQSSTEFTFYTTPDAAPTQCQSFDFSWDSNAQAPIYISGIVPGGESFQIPTNGGTSQDWTADLKQGTVVAFMVGDSTGRGKGGSSDLMTVQDGSSGNCLNANSPSSTAGPAAGAVSTPAGSPSSSAAAGSSTGSATAAPSGSSSASGVTYSSEASFYSSQIGSGGGTVIGAPEPSPVATGAGGSGQQNSNGSDPGSTTTTSSSHTNIGAIVGGVVGGVVLLILLLLALWLCRRRRAARKPLSEKEPVDLLQQSPAPGAGNASAHRPGSQWYHPAPFVPPTARPAASSGATPSTAAATENGGAGAAGGRRATATDPASASSPSSAVPGSSLPPVAESESASSTQHDRDIVAAAAQHDPKKRPAGAAAPSMRPVNWVQHDDAGAVPVSPPVAETGPEPVTVDVPPSYDTIGGRRA